MWQELILASTTVPEVISVGRLLKGRCHSTPNQQEGGGGKEGGGGEGGVEVVNSGAGRSAVVVAKEQLGGGYELGGGGKREEEGRGRREEGGGVFRGAVTRNKESRSLLRPTAVPVGVGQEVGGGVTYHSSSIVVGGLQVGLVAHCSASGDWFVRVEVWEAIEEEGVVGQGVRRNHPIPSAPSSSSSPSSLSPSSSLLRIGNTLHHY